MKRKSKGKVKLSAKRKAEIDIAMQPLRCLIEDAFGLEMHIVYGDGTKPSYEIRS